MRHDHWKQSCFLILLFSLILTSCSDADDSDSGAREVYADKLFSLDEHTDELAITFFDLQSSEASSQSGEAILVHTPKGKNLMIDAGLKELGDVLDERLSSMGIDKLDIVLPSHPHSDHIGGFITLFETMSIGKVIDINLPLDSRTYAEYERVMKDCDIDSETAEAGEKIEIEDDLELEILAPTQEKVETYSEMENLSAGIVNDLSMIVKMIYRDHIFLFTGDVYKGAEEDLVNTYKDDLESDVVVVPHHGIGTSSSTKFTDTVNPDISIIASNILMDKSVYDHYSESSQVFVNELDGNILLTTDGKQIDVYTEKEREKMKEGYLE